MGSILALVFVVVAVAKAAETYYNLAVYAPTLLQLDGKVINAVDQGFVIGALKPSTSCELYDPSDCPPGNITLVNDEMTSLAVRLCC